MAYHWRYLAQVILGVLHLESLHVTSGNTSLVPPISSGKLEVLELSQHRSYFYLVLMLHHALDASYSKRIPQESLPLKN